MTEDAPINEMQSTIRKRKYKKKKDFLSNAKKYAKKGQMGRGTKIPDELYQYFVGILDAMKQGIDSADERISLVNNVLERTKGEELNIIGNQLGCRVIELLLPYSSPEDFERFMDTLSPELRRLCSDNFTSHVVETVLRVACERATEHLQSASNDDLDSDEENTTDNEVPKKKAKVEKSNDSKYSQDHVQKCHDCTLKICKYALNNLEDFVWDAYANHILRSALKCLCGITLLPGEKPKVNIFKEETKHKGIPPHITKMTFKIVPDDFKTIAQEFAVRLSSWPQFKDMPYQNITSGLLQVLLYATKNVDKGLTRSLLKQLLNESFAPDDWVPKLGDDDAKEDVKKDICDTVEEEDEKEEKDIVMQNLPPVFESEPAVRLLEAALFVAKKKMYTQIYAKCFINRLGRLSTVPMLNFTVQRLIDNCRIKEEFEPMYDELGDKFTEVLACGNTGVLVALAKACLRIKSRQTQFVSHLESALKCSEQDRKKYFSVLCLRLLPFERVDVDKLDKDYFINIHGSIILQTLLDFQRPTKAVNSLLELSPEQVLVILNDAKGCHVADAFCQGQYVGVKSREKFIHKLRGYYQKLALSQYGSRSFEQIFNVASLEQKIRIVTELADKSNLLNSTSYGRLISTKLDVATFKVSQKKWEQCWKKKYDISKE